jgi:hypothetical protein
VSNVRSASHLTVLTAILAGSGGVACAATIGQGRAGTGSSGTGTVGPGTTVNAGPGTGSTVPSGPPKGTPAEQTHPTMLPATGRAHTRFTVRLTLADTLGHSGVVASDYRLQLTTPAKTSASRCGPRTPPANIESGTAGEVLRIPLTAPTSGWCAGRYQLTVFLQRGPYCPPPAAGQPPPPCPEFASQELDVGETSFTITTPRHHNRPATSRADTT